MARRRLSPSAAVFAILLLPLFTPVWVLLIEPPFDQPVAAQEKTPKRAELPASRPPKAPMVVSKSFKKETPSSQRPSKTSELARKTPIEKPIEKRIPQAVTNKAKTSPTRKQEVRTKTDSVAGGSSLNHRATETHVSDQPAVEASSELPERQTPHLLDDLPAKTQDQFAESFTAIIPPVNHTQQSSNSESMPLSDDVTEESASAPAEPTIVQASFVEPSPSPLEDETEPPVEVPQQTSSADQMVKANAFANELPFDEPDAPEPIEKLASAAQREATAPPKEPRNDEEIADTSVPTPLLPSSPPPISNTRAANVHVSDNDSTESPKVLAQKAPFVASDLPAKPTQKTSPIGKVNATARKSPIDKPSGKLSYSSPAPTGKGIGSSMTGRAVPKIPLSGKRPETAIAKSDQSIPRTMRTIQPPTDSLVAKAMEKPAEPRSKVAPAEEFPPSPSPVVVQLENPRFAPHDDDHSGLESPIQSATQLTRSKALPDDVEDPATQLADDDLITLRKHFASRPATVPTTSSAEQTIANDDDLKSLREHFSHRPIAVPPSPDKLDRDAVVQIDFDKKVPDDQPTEVAEARAAEPTTLENNTEVAAEAAKTNDALASVLADLMPVRKINVQNAVHLPPVAEGDSPTVLQPTDHAKSVLSRRVPVNYAATDWSPWQAQRDSYPFFHKPLYFEDPNLERCGRGWGSMTTAISISLFYSTIPTLPYRVTAEPASCSVPTLPDCSSCQRFGADAYLPPWSWKAAAVQSAATVGFIYAVP